MRPIDAESIKLPKGFFENVNNVPKFYEWLNTLPTIDPVKHGKWEYDKGLYRCTACNDLLTVAGWDIPEKVIYTNFKYCPNCGARMDG